MLARIPEVVLRMAMAAAVSFGKSGCAFKRLIVAVSSAGSLRRRK